MSKIYEIRSKDATPPVRLNVNKGRVLVYRNNTFTDVWPPLVSFQHYRVTWGRYDWRFFKMVSTGLKIDEADFLMLLDEGHFELCELQLAPSKQAEVLADDDLAPLLMAS